MKLFKVTAPAFIFSLALLATPSLDAQIVVGQIETFDSGNAGFQEGDQTPNAPVFNSGPGADGAAGHLQNVSSGGGPGGRWLQWTDNAAWTGDYTSAGVTAIDLFVDNRSGSGTNLDFRLGLQGDGGFFVSNAFSVADGSGFVPISFDLSGLSYVSGSGGTNDLSQTLSTVNRLELLSSVATPSFRSNAGGFLRGDQLVADVRIDNLRAVGAAVPEPGSLVIFFSAAAMLGCRRRR